MEEPTFDIHSEVFEHIKSLLVLKPEPGPARRSKKGQLKSYKQGVPKPKFETEIHAFNGFTGSGNYVTLNFEPEPSDDRDPFPSDESIVSSRSDDESHQPIVYKDPIVGAISIASIPKAHAFEMQKNHLNDDERIPSIADLIAQLRAFQQIADRGNDIVIAMGGKRIYFPRVHVAEFSFFVALLDFREMANDESRLVDLSEYCNNYTGPDDLKIVLASAFNGGRVCSCDLTLGAIDLANCLGYDAFKQNKITIARINELKNGDRPVPCFENVEDRQPAPAASEDDAAEQARKALEAEELRLEKIAARELSLWMRSKAKNTKEAFVAKKLAQSAVAAVEQYVAPCASAAPIKPARVVVAEPIALKNDYTVSPYIIEVIFNAMLAHLTQYSYETYWGCRPEECFMLEFIKLQYAEIIWFTCEQHLEFRKQLLATSLGYKSRPHEWSLNQMRHFNKIETFSELWDYVHKMCGREPIKYKRIDVFRYQAELKTRESWIDAELGVYQQEDGRAATKERLLRDIQSSADKRAAAAAPQKNAEIGANARRNAMEVRRQVAAAII